LPICERTSKHSRCSLNRQSKIANRKSLGSPVAAYFPQNSSQYVLLRIGSGTTCKACAKSSSQQNDIGLSAVSATISGDCRT